MTAAPDRIVLSDWTPAWSALFARERDRLEAVFPPGDFRIEHVGSTAVPGLVAKPVVDIMVGAPHLSAIEARLPALAPLGYTYLASYERWIPDRRFCARPAAWPRTVHLHAVVAHGEFWEDHLAFRDALRNNSATADAYAALKRQLAAEFALDREAYTDGKSDFVHEVLRRIRGPAP